MIYLQPKSTYSKTSPITVCDYELTGEQREGLTGQGDEEDILGGMRGIDYDSRPDLRAGQV